MISNQNHIPPPKKLYNIQTGSIISKRKRKGSCTSTPWCSPSSGRPPPRAGKQRFAREGHPPGRGRRHGLRAREHTDVLRHPLERHGLRGRGDRHQEGEAPDAVRGVRQGIRAQSVLVRLPAIAAGLGAPRRWDKELYVDEIEIMWTKEKRQDEGNAEIEGDGGSAGGEQPAGGGDARGSLTRAASSP